MKFVTVHHYLESGWTINYSKEHHQGLKQAIIDIEGNLPLVFRLDVHVVETPADIQFGDVFGSTEL